MYLTYEEYQNMGGQLDDTAFTKLEFEARSYVDSVTFNRLVRNPLTTIPEELKHCMYDLVELFSIKTNTISGIIVDGKLTGNIIKQENDGVSTSYSGVSTRQSITLSEQEILNKIRNYLHNTKDSKGHLVLYRGIYEDE